MVGVLAQKWIKAKKAEKQKNKIFKELINEIDNMSIEEYNKYHQEALKMKKAHDDMIQALSDTLSN